MQYSNVVIIKKKGDDDIQIPGSIEFDKNLSPVINSIFSNFQSEKLTYILIHFEESNKLYDFTKHITNFRNALIHQAQSKKKSIPGNLFIFPISNGCTGDDEFCKAAKELYNYLKGITDTRDIDRQYLKNLETLWGQKKSEKETNKKRKQILHSYSIFCIYCESAFLSNKFAKEKMRAILSSQILSKTQDYWDSIYSEIGSKLQVLSELLDPTGTFRDKKLNSFIGIGDDGPVVDIQNTEWMKMLKELKNWAYEENVG